MYPKYPIKHETVVLLHSILHQPNGMDQANEGKLEGRISNFYSCYRVNFMHTFHLYMFYVGSYLNTKVKILGSPLSTIQLHHVDPNKPKFCEIYHHQLNLPLITTTWYRFFLPILNCNI
jgi:hypothetical protein